MKKIIINSEPSKQQLDSLLELYQTGEYAEAEKLSLSITQEFPEHQFAWRVLTVILQQAGKLSESLFAAQKSAQLNPKDAVSHYNLSSALKDLNKLNEAALSNNRAIALKPDFTEAHYNLGNILLELGKLEEAEASYGQAITCRPDYAEAHNNLGNILKLLGKLKEAEASYRRAITLKSNYADAHYNLGVILQKLNKLEAKSCYKKSTPPHKLEEAEACYRKAIALNSNLAHPYNNLGNLLKELGKLEEAEESYRQAIVLNSNFAEVYNNLGVLLYSKGELMQAIHNYKLAIKIKPEFTEFWYNIYFPLQVIKSQKSTIQEHLPLLDDQVSSKKYYVIKSILSYLLNRGNTSTDRSLKEVLNSLSSIENVFINNPKAYSNKLIKDTLPKKITALIYFGRSGTGLLHSLIDGHPEITTLPSIYFSDFFNHSTWEKIIAHGWSGMADNFASIYPILFDASNKFETFDFIGIKDGMANVGTDRNEVLSVDKKGFIKELNQLMDCYDHLDAFIFFKLIHLAYEITLKNFKEKSHIFYHIHDPDTHAKLNFLKLAPNTNWLMMVREPLQNCESSIKKSYDNNDYKSISIRIFQILFEVDQSIFQRDNSIGVRLEDLKEYPKKTIPAICGWLGIKEHDSLYQMTAQGKRWWGDPSGLDYKKDGMDPFGKSSINRKLGSVFSENDQFILRTLFYPFSVLFNYVEEDLDQFKNDLKSVRPMLDQMFDFERKIVEHEKMNSEIFMKSGDYLYLRSGMIERWNTLNKHHTYPNMLNPLMIH